MDPAACLQPQDTQPGPHPTCDPTCAETPKLPPAGCPCCQLTAVSALPSMGLLSPAAAAAAAGGVSASMYACVTSTPGTDCSSGAQAKGKGVPLGLKEAA